MFSLFADIAETDITLKAINEAIAELKSYEILVGIPEENNGRTAEGSIAATNAELLYIHTNGSPINGIPARPVVEPAIEHNKEQVAELLQNAADAALDGNKEGVLPALEKAGMYGQNIARAWFTNSANGWARNNPATIKAKGSNKPLIDTGDMRKAINYKVEKV